MDKNTLNKLVLQLLPAVAASHAPTTAEGPEQTKQMWGEYLDEAASLAALFEQKFMQADKEKILNAELIAQTL